VQGTKITVYPSVTLAKEVEQAAADNDQSVSQWMQEAARHKLQLEQE
jgi:hypothetical protein